MRNQQNETHPPLSYRPDVDGLRAIAVLAVLVFHLDESLLPGGFVGVDIFFVISGYLITRLIVNEIEATGQFQFGQFYVRRVRRLFPALLATFLLSVVLAYHLLSPAHLIDFARSLITAVLSVSNFYFWQSADYFDFASQSKPLLHTWSLSVEEQFYLFWPITLVLLARLSSAQLNRRLVLLFMAVMIVASLTLNIAWFNHQARLEDAFTLGDVRSFAFYMLPFRVYEFGLGAALVLINIERMASWFRVLCFVAGLSLICWSFWQLSSRYEFPSHRALAPCLGAALMIAAGPQHALARLINNQFLVKTGLISYSLYLIHWPLIVFYRYQKTAELTLIDMVMISFVSLLLAAMMYRFIEQPFRKNKVKSSFATSAKTGSKSFLTGAAVSALALMTLAYNAQASGGWLWRYPTAVVEQLKYTRDDYAAYFWQNIEFLRDTFDDNGKPKVMVIGDSMAADLVNVFVESGVAEQLDLAAIKIDGNCKTMFALTEAQYQSIFAGRKALCQAEHAKVFTALEQIRSADAVILATFLTIDHFVQYVVQGAHYLSDQGARRVMLLGQKTQKSDGLAFLAKMAFTPSLHKIKTPLNDSAARINNLLKRQTKRYQYIDLLPQFCSKAGCQRVTREGHLIVFDGAHLSQQGARFIGRNLDKTEWFQEILALNNERVGEVQR